MYAVTNHKTKKAFKESVYEGVSNVQDVLTFDGMNKYKVSGTYFVEGPWYPAAHTWYAEVHTNGGIITSVK